MSRTDDLRALHAAELAVVEAEELFVAAKGAVVDRAELTELAHALREARRAYRELCAADPADGVARPATIATVSSTPDLGA
jgi:hypothetical protein